jgi:adenylate cyclase
MKIRSRSFKVGLKLLLGAAMKRWHSMLRFEGYILDVARGCLRTTDREVALRPKSFEVLRYLVERAGRLVEKDEVLKAVWPNVIVTDESLAQCISEVRQAIGDSEQAIIKTVPRRGYRFVAPVSQFDADAHTEAALHAADLAVSARREADTGIDQRFESPCPDRPSIAVLAFTNLGGDTRQEYFSDGISEDIITELSRFSELLVIARNSTFQYKGKPVDIRQAGQELGARYVLEGSVRREADRIRITAQLIDARTGGHLWAERYDRELTNVFAIQDEVARAIVAILAAHVNKAEAERTLLKPPTSWEAYDYYLRAAEAYRLRGRLKTSIEETRRLLRQSLAIDPDYARALAALSATYWWTYVEPLDDDYVSPSGLERAYDLANKAVQLAPDLPEAHAQLGYVLIFKCQHQAGLAEFEQAFTLNRNFIDNRFAHGLAFAGEPARAIEVLRANIRLDPFHTFISFGFLGHAHYMLRRYDEAAQTLRVYPSRAPIVRILPLWLAASYAQLGQRAEAQAQAAEVIRMEPGFTIERWMRTAVYKNPNDAEHLFEGLRKAGLPDG